MGEPDRCDISAMALESVARPVDEGSAGFHDLGRGGVGVVGWPADADLAGPQSEIGIEGFERRLAFDDVRRDGQFSPIEHDGEPKPARARSARAANLSGGSVGAAVVAWGTWSASVCRDQLGLNATRDTGKRSGRLPSTSVPIPRRAPKESWQRKAVSRRPRNRVGRPARDLFNDVPRRDRSRGLQGLLYAGHFNIAALWQDNRLLGLDPFDWFILLGGSVLSGAIVLLS